MADFYAMLAEHYDLMYAHKDYKSEVDFLKQVIEKYKISPGNTLLDVACGTGGHIEFLKEYYSVVGVDLSEQMLKVAREKFPDIEFLQSDMSQMALGRQFDVITCLFGSINYIHTSAKLSNAIRGFSNHLNRGGILILEPIFTKEKFYEGNVGLDCVDEPEIKIARMGRARREGEIAYLDFHFLVGTKEGIEYFTDPSPMSLFSHDTYISVLEENGFQAKHEKKGSERSSGLFIGINLGV